MIIKVPIQALTQQELIEYAAKVDQAEVEEAFPEYNVPHAYQREHWDLPSQATINTSAIFGMAVKLREEGWSESCLEDHVYNPPPGYRSRFLKGEGYWPLCFSLEAAYNLSVENPNPDSF